MMPNTTPLVPLRSARETRPWMVTVISGQGVLVLSAWALSICWRCAGVREAMADWVPWIHSRPALM